MYSTLVFPDPGLWGVIELPFVPDRIVSVEALDPDSRALIPVPPDRWRRDGARIKPVVEWPNNIEIRVLVAS